eukprot:TRINITY_DN66127_c3_g3_i1.p1 TRINITY_DN66127_c3_g3~~TRINITY_DN66127_c3_g3_i1.p1  ORF type:complete len:890 (+),score=492.79 TRINITY_DN66127_c3_g3_i1:75-2744(+)
MFSIVIVFFVLVAIFTNDVRLLLFDRSADAAFDVIMIVVFAFFMIEFAMNIFAVDDYVGSFDFWVDLLAAVSILPDVAFVWDPIVGQDSTGDFDSNSISNIQASRAALAGSRIGQVVKLVRLVRWIRLIKLFDNWLISRREQAEFEQQHQQARALVRQLSSVHNNLNALKGVTSSDDVAAPAPLATAQSSQRFGGKFGGNRRSSMGWSTTGGGGGGGGATTRRRGSIANGMPSSAVPVLPTTSRKPSKVAERVSEGTTRVVTALVVMMVLIVSIFQPFDEDETARFALVHLNTLSNSASTSTSEFNTAVDFATKSFVDDWGLLYLEVQGSAHSYVFQHPDINDFRIVEMSAFVVDRSKIVYSVKALSREQSLYDILRSVLVMGFLWGGVLLHNRDANRLVLGPVQRMVKTISRFQHNPLSVTTKHSNNHDDDSEDSEDSEDDDGGGGDGSGGGTGSESDSKATLSRRRRNKARRRHRRKLLRKKSNKRSYETYLLESTFEKLTRLLQVGFGQAGAQVIRKNLRKAHGDLDPLVEGRKVFAIFGFMDIRNFTDMTECLKEQVMLFVNSVAEVAYSEAVRCDGAPNKNIGDAFLLVWRLPRRFNESDLQRFMLGIDSTRDVPREKEALYEQVSLTADKALTAFQRIMGRVGTSKTIQGFSTHHLVQARMGKDFKVRLGSGLHVGWAIEGPIGSKYKIDVSYLSADVNMSMTLEALTKKYSVPMLASGPFVSLLSPGRRDTFDYVDDYVEGERTISLHATNRIPTTVNQLRRLRVPIISELYMSVGQSQLRYQNNDDDHDENGEYGNSNQDDGKESSDRVGNLPNYMMDAGGGGGTGAGDADGNGESSSRQRHKRTYTDTALATHTMTQDPIAYMHQQQRQQRKLHQQHQHE